MTLLLITFFQTLDETEFERLTNEIRIVTSGEDQSIAMDDVKDILAVLDAAETQNFEVSEWQSAFNKMPYKAMLFLT